MKIWYKVEKTVMYPYNWCRDIECYLGLQNSLNLIKCKENGVTDGTE